MTLQGRADLSSNQGNAAAHPATVHEPVVTQWAVHPPAPAPPSLPDKVEKVPSQAQHEGRKSKEHLPQQPAQAKTVSRHIPRLRAVVESQAFKNILVDEMDMMHARAATLIQANWRGYRLRQKLISQMMAAKAIQEAWRRFNKRHILHSSKLLVKKMRAEEGDIPYHAPQQVRFQHPEENRLLSLPIMVNKETQFPSCDNLVLCRPQSSPLLQPPAAQGTQEPCVQAPHVARVQGVAFLPHQTVTIRFPCPVSLDAKCQPFLLTRTIRSTCLVHIEGDSVKTKRVTAQTNKAGAPGTPLSRRYNQAVTGPSRAQTRGPVKAETPKAPFQICPGPMITKTLLQTYPASTTTTIPPKTSPVPKVTTKTPAQMYPGPTVIKTAPHTCPVPTMTKIQVHPTASRTGTPRQTCPATITAKNQPQVSLLASIMKSPPQVCPGSAIAKSPPQTHPVATPAKNPLQTCLAATMSKTSSQMSPVGVTKPSPQTRLAAMITKTPAQLRSVATIFKTLYLASPTVANVKAPPQAAVAARTPNTPGSIHENPPKAKATMNVKQAAEAVKASFPSYLAEGKIRCLAQPHLGTGVPRAPAKLPLEAEKIKTGPQKQVKTDMAFKTRVAVEMAGAPSWTKVAEEGDKPPHVYVPVDMAVTLPRGQPAAPLTNASSQRHPPCLSQRPLAALLTKASSEGHLPTELSKTPSLAHLVTCLSKMHSQAHPATGAMKVQSQAPLATCLTKTQSQGQPITDITKCHIPAHQAADLSSNTHSQVLLTGSKVSNHACQYLGGLSAPHWAKPEDRQTQPQPHRHVPGKTTQGGPCPAACEVQGMLVPLMAPTGHSTCNVESWGDSGATRAQPSMPGQAVPCQEDTVGSLLASLCAEVADVLASQEDLRTLLAKALSQGEVRAALNQGLSKEVLDATVTKSLPQSTLSMALVKALSWSELCLTLSRALSRGELRAELTKVMQGKLAEVLSKALTEEWAALSQALCQGELGVLLSQSWCRVALRTGTILPKATLKSTGSRVTKMPAPAEVACRRSLLAPWGPSLGPVRPQTSKGPADAGVASGQSWNHAWEPARCAASWDTRRNKAVVHPRQSREPMVSMQAAEEIRILAVITIQAGVRGYLARCRIRMWHQGATVIQAAWRGYRVRWNLAHLCRATTIIQAAWRSYSTRRDQARHRQMLHSVTWVELGGRARVMSDRSWFQDGRARTVSDHRCFQSCQAHACSVCHSLSSRIGSPPSVVMLVGSSSRTCHTCGRTQPTRVVQGMGRGAGGPGAVSWASTYQRAAPSPRQPHRQDKAATAIQSAWRGFKIRQQMRQQQMAAKMVQAIWRGHHTRSCLKNTEALLGPADPWASSRHTHWPGI
ncbi:LOW QUALITY PROTEIN: IQ domain-containing protein N [Nomascus leucogenys]|uniref:LOW QUALITY PROTEIN: IQ domain-containing protein N n=1 Tax=Nomascus leucogenys TaxID=61853 RepID=UPI00122D6778|nr:LOW QUALITY PROTEIN: IQ domain-containing protein N [Nomascus leucogenys]